LFIVVRSDGKNRLANPAGQAGLTERQRRFRVGVGSGAKVLVSLWRQIGYQARP
jgi:hypothetical protein